MKTKNKTKVKPVVKKKARKPSEKMLRHMKRLNALNRKRHAAARKAKGVKRKPAKRAK